MRLVLVMGLALVLLGAFVVVANPSLASERGAMRMGDLEVSIEGQRAVPPWVGWTTIVGGLLLVGRGLTRQRHA